MRFTHKLFLDSSLPQVNKMKEFNSSVRKNTFSSVFVKSAVCFLLLGFAYRMFSSSLLQFSPLFGSVDPNDELDLDADEAMPPQSAAEPPPEITDDPSVKVNGHDYNSEKENATEKCNIFIGDWVPNPDGPMYTNATCGTIEEPQNCMRNGRPDSGYIYWRWKPKDCDLPKFDPNKFLKMMERKSLAFIGDSIMRNQVQSLLCMLSQVEKAVDIYHDEAYRNRKWLFPSHNFTVSLVWCPFLSKALIFEDENGVTTDIIRLHLDELDPVWIEKYENLDYAVIGGGKWFLKNALYYENNTLVGCHNCHNPNITQLGFVYAYRKALNMTLKFISGSKRKKPVTIFRTSAPDHFENGEWNTGGYCNRTRPFKTGEIEINYTDETMRNIELEEFERAEKVGNANGITSLKMFDPTFVSLLRPDGHPGVYRKFQPYAGKEKGAKIQNDCLHWCLPGPIDSWNDLMMEMI